MILVAIALATLSSAGDKFIATACLSRSDAANTEPRLEAVQRALQARVVKRGIQVALCGSAQADWRIILVNKERGALDIDIEGLHVSRVEHVNLMGLTELEAIQITALTAAEAIRPAVDRLVLELGGAAKMEAPVANDWADRVAPVQQRVIEEAHRSPPERSTQHHLTFGLLAGPMLDDQRQLFGYAELTVALPILRDVGLTAHASLAETGNHVRHGVEVDRRTYQLGVGAETYLGAFSFGAQVRLRFLNAQTSAAPEAVSQTFAGLGTGLSARWSALRWSVFDLGLAFQGWLWPQPRRLNYDGERVLTEGFVEVFVGPTLHAHLP